MKKPLNSLLAMTLAAMLMLSFTSCDNEPVDQRPELPPVESFVMDFSNFTNQPAGMKNSELTYKNFLLSFTTVAYWSAKAAMITALPAAAYTYALSETPEYTEDEVWEWSYEFEHDGISYKATLLGKRLDNEEFSVEMFIAEASMPEEEYKWFDGVVRYDHTVASWNLYKEGNLAVLEIYWNNDFETEEADLTYTYVEPDQTETGSYITWEYRPGEDFDASYNMSMSEGMTVIEWNVSNMGGRIQSPAFYEDENWHCWDSFDNGLADIACE